MANKLIPVERAYETALGDNVSIWTVYKLVRSGELPCVRVGRRVFLNAHADGVTRLIRWTGSLDQVPVWSAPRFAAAIGIDTGVRFP